MKHSILGCGDIGRRIAKQLIDNGVESDDLVGYVNSQSSQIKSQEMGFESHIIDLDEPEQTLFKCHDRQLYYTIAPQKNGHQDQRSEHVIQNFEANSITPTKVVLISTTGVYGDCLGQWVDEQSQTLPQTGRGKRRLNSEQTWLSWGSRHSISVSVLRAPGIYAYSRIPRQRIINKTPVVKASECGYTNRIHADDLANACILAMDKAKHQDIFNATDGVPGKISEYLQAAAKVIESPPLPEITMQQAQQQLSQGMLSYLSESRKISNRKLIEELGLKLQYPDFRVGLRF